MSTNAHVQTIMDANILTRPNFLDWLKNLRIVLKREKLAYVVMEPIPKSPVADAPESVQIKNGKKIIYIKKRG